MRGLVIETALGWMGLGFGAGGLCATTLPNANRAHVEEQLHDLGIKGLISEADADGWPEKFRRYAAGQSRRLDGKIDVSKGTQFQQAVWQATRGIPFGETRTYGDIARHAGYPLAARAVGRAMHANPLPLVVPCHRVVAANGIGGFGGRVDLKRTLLDLEGTRIQPQDG